MLQSASTDPAERRAALEKLCEAVVETADGCKAKINALSARLVRAQSVSTLAADIYTVVEACRAAADLPTDTPYSPPSVRDAAVVGKEEAVRSAAMRSNAELLSKLNAICVAAAEAAMQGIIPEATVVSLGQSAKRIAQCLLPLEESRSTVVGIRKEVGLPTQPRTPGMSEEMKRAKLLEIQKRMQAQEDARRAEDEQRKRAAADARRQYAEQERVEAEQKRAELAELAKRHEEAVQHLEAAALAHQEEKKRKAAMEEQARQQERVRRFEMADEAKLAMAHLAAEEKFARQELRPTDLNFGSLITPVSVSATADPKAKKEPIKLIACLVCHAPIVAGRHKCHHCGYWMTDLVKD
eukprot:m51a1_g1925 hypothetical protein (354) ;mRNA; f:873438-874605